MNEKKNLFGRAKEPKVGDLVVFEDAAGKVQKAIFLGLNRDGSNKIKHPVTGMVGQTASKLSLAESIQKPKPKLTRIEELLTNTIVEVEKTAIDESKEDTFVRNYIDKNLAKQSV